MECTWAPPLNPTPYTFFGKPSRPQVCIKKIPGASDFLAQSPTVYTKKYCSTQGEATSGGAAVPHSTVSLKIQGPK